MVKQKFVVLLKRIGKISVGNLPGALIVLAATALVSDKVPWFFERIYVSSDDDNLISINVNKLFEKQNICMDSKRYVICNIEKGFSILGPKASGWEKKELSPGEMLNGFSVCYIPNIKALKKIVEPIFSPGDPDGIDLYTATIGKKGQSFKIKISDRTEIGGLPINFNLFKYQDFYKSGLQIANLFLDNQPFFDVIPDNMKQSILENKGYEFVSKYYPKNFEVQNHLTINVFSKSFLNSSPISKIVFDKVNQADNVVNYFSKLIVLNEELFFSNFENIQISKNNRVLLVESSLPISNIYVDETLHENLIVKKTFLIAINKLNVYIFRIQYVDGIPGFSKSHLELASLMKTLKISE